MDIAAWMDEEYKLTEKHFKIYKDEFLYWVDILGLKGWEFVYNLVDLPDARAQIMPDATGRIVVVLLNTIWEGQEPTDYELKRTGYHEALELFFYKMTTLAAARSTTMDEIEEETHNLIRTLENVIWEKDYAARLSSKKRRKKKQ